MCDDKYVRATLPQRAIGRLMKDVKRHPHMWLDFRSIILNMSSMIVSYSVNAALCKRTLDYLEKIFKCENAKDLIEWGKPFSEFTKAFDKMIEDKTPEELEEFCKEASAKLLKEE